MRRKTAKKRIAGLGLALLLLTACSARPVAVIGGEDVQRDEARFVMRLTAERYAMYTGGEAGDEELRAMTLHSLTAARVLRDKTAFYGCPLTADNEAWLALAMAEDELDSGGADAVDALLKSWGGTRELYRLYQYEVALLEDALYDCLFGPGGPYEPGDAELEAFCEDGMARCAYIYLSLTDENGLHLTGEDRDRLRSVAEAIRREAEGSPGAFADLVTIHGQDYVMGLSPEGMTLPKDLHGDGFRRALDALAPGGISPVVETADGLYIILRLEPDPDYLDAHRAEAEDAYRLSVYASLMDQWRGEIGVEVMKGFEKLGVEG